MVDEGGWDVFISYASEDRESVAAPLAALLRERGLRVWLDRNQLQIGDSLSGKIDDGLARSRYGVVILSPSFFSREFPRAELSGLVARQQAGRKVILPVWHHVNTEFVARYSPMVAGMVAIETGDGLATVASHIAEVVKSGDHVSPEPQSPGALASGASAMVSSPGAVTPGSTKAAVTPSASSSTRESLEPVWQPIPKSGRPEHRPMFGRFREIQAPLDCEPPIYPEPNGRLFGCLRGNSVLLIEPRTGEVVATLCDDTAPVSTMTWVRPSGENRGVAELVFGTTDGYVSWWARGRGIEDWKRIQLIRLRDEHAHRPVKALCAQRESREMFVATDSVALLWYIDGVCLREARFRHSGTVTFAPEAPVCVSSIIPASDGLNSDGELLVQICLLRQTAESSRFLEKHSWLTRLKLTSELGMLPEARVHTGHYGFASREPPVSLSATADLMAVGVNWEHWSVMGLPSGGGRIHSVAPRTLSAIALSRDGQECAIGQSNGEILVCRAASGDVMQALPGHTAPIVGLTYSLDRKFLVSWSKDRRIRIWRAA